RLGTAVLLLWLVATLTFELVRLAPGDPAQFLIAPDASGAELVRLRTELGLDDPLPVQYARWMAGWARGDLGTSLARSRPVADVLADALPVSLALGGVSLLLSFVIGAVVGLFQAAIRGRPADRAITVLTTAAYAAPTFWIALALV